MIEAAGGVVLREDGDGVEVLVVHRVRHDDWSLPKGKLDPGEDALTAACREVREETGVDVEVDGKLPEVRYEVDGQPKRVRWYRMRAVAGDPAARPADHEVDVAAWWPVEDALRRLTYAHDRDLLAGSLTGDPS